MVRPDRFAYTSHTKSFFAERTGSSRDYLSLVCADKKGTHHDVGLRRDVGSMAAMTSSNKVETKRQNPVPPPPFRWGTRVLLPAGLISAFAYVVITSVSETFTPVLQVQTIPVVQRESILRSPAMHEPASAQSVIQAAGWVEPDPFPTYVTTLTYGTVQEVLFLEGDTVQPGAILARLNPDDAKLELERATSELRAAQEAWDENINATLEAATATAGVSEILAMLDQARAELLREQALLADAEVLLGRLETLTDESRAKQQYDTAAAQAAVKAADERAARARIAELEATHARRQAEEAAARKRLELRTEDRRRLEEARIGVAEAQLRMARMEIVAPVAGVIMERLVYTGSMLMAFSENAEMARVAAIYDPARLQVRVDVPLADAAKVGRGQQALVTVEVLPDRTFEGTVSRITSRADIQKNTLEVKVALAEPSPLLKPDMLARVRFLATADPDENAASAGLSVFALEDALAAGGAWVVSNYDGTHGVASWRTVVTTGAEDQGWVEVESGLLPGDLLIVPTPPDLREGQRVNVIRQGEVTHGHD